MHTVLVYRCYTNMSDFYLDIFQRIAKEKNLHDSLKFSQPTLHFQSQTVQSFQHWFNTWLLIFVYLCLFLYFFQEKNLYLKNTVLLKLLEVIVHVCIRSTSTFIQFTLKIWLGKLIFLHTLFLENEAQINKNNYRMMLSCQNKSVCQKLARSCKN